MLIPKGNFAGDEDNLSPFSEENYIEPDDVDDFFRLLADEVKSANVRRIFGDGKYDSFRDQLLDKCKTDAQRCPFCEEPYDELAEFVDVGVGMVQVTPNYCSNEECGASETGQYELDKNLYDFKDGWHRPKDWSMLPVETIRIGDDDPKETYNGPAER